jgi:hypothetical protein
MNGEEERKERKKKISPHYGDYEAIYVLTRGVMLQGVGEVHMVRSGFNFRRLIIKESLPALPVPLYPILTPILGIYFFFFSLPVSVIARLILAMHNLE